MLGDEKRPRYLYAIASATSSSKPFKIQITVNKKSIRALVDLGVSRNFILTRFVKQHGFATRQKRQEIELVVVDGLGLLSVTRETVLLRVLVQQYYEHLRFDITDIASHDIILGAPQLKQYNLIIDQRIGVLRFRQYNYIVIIYSRRWQRSPRDEKLG